MVADVRVSAYSPGRPGPPVTGNNSLFIAPPGNAEDLPLPVRGTFFPRDLSIPAPSNRRKDGGETWQTLSYTWN
jgi:hypothetical protein